LPEKDHTCAQRVNGRYTDTSLSEAPISWSYEQTGEALA
jgi:hypothetical protein